MEFPLWAVFGLISASLSAVMMLIQERVKLHGFTMAFWNKVACMVFMLPLVLLNGLPDNPYFYILITVQAGLWAISDVIFFGAITKVGAGLVSRLLPASTIITFCLWFLISPASWEDYMATPVRSAAIFAVLCLSVYFAMRLKKCSISWQAVRIIWFVIFAAVIGPLLVKLVMGQASFAQGPFAYVFFESLAMVVMWSIFYTIKHPVPAQDLFSRQALKAGFMVGFVSSFMVAANAAAIHLVDNPGLIPAIKFTDTVIILAYYKWIGHKEQSDVLTGLGVVACASAIIILKSI